MSVSIENFLYHENITLRKKSHSFSGPPEKLDKAEYSIPKMYLYLYRHFWEMKNIFRFIYFVCYNTCFL